MSKKKKTSFGIPESSARVHVLPDSAEPRAEKTPLPMFLFVPLVVLAFASDMFLTHNRGGFDSRVYEPYRDFADVQLANPIDPAVAARMKGKRVYDVNCLPCHQASGLGLPAQFPPLAGSEWVLTPGPDRIARLVISGIQGPISVNGQNFNNAMPPWGPALTDDDIAAVITFVRSEWGNKASAVTPDHIAAIRKQLGNRPPWDPAELLKTPDK